MSMLTRCAVIVGISLSPLSGVAQSIQSNSWREVFDHGFPSIEVLADAERINIDSTPSLEPGRLRGRCEVGAPDSVVLIGRSKYSPAGEKEWFWLPTFAVFDSSHSGPEHEQRVSAPFRADTLRVRITRTICENHYATAGEYLVPTSFVLEHAGRYVHMEMPSTPQGGMVWLFAKASDGRLSELRWSPVRKRIEDVARARARWTAASWQQKAMEWVLSAAVYVGMTTDMVHEAWGYPEEINQTTTAYGTSEQWVYGNGRYVYVVNGRVTAIQK